MMTPKVAALKKVIRWRDWQIDNAMTRRLTAESKCIIILEGGEGCDSWFVTDSLT